MKRFAFGLVALATVLALSAWPASVTLIYFRAATQADGSILVTWETATELNSLAYQIYRAQSQNGPWDRMVDQQAAIGGVTGASYQYLDSDVTPGTTYYYLLAEVETDSSVIRYDTWIASATAGTSNVPTPTPTPTRGFGAITGTVCYDLNGDGYCAHGEPGLLDVRVRLFTQGVQIGGTRTRGDGRYWFRSVVPGVYELREVNPPWLRRSSSPDRVVMPVAAGRLAVVDFADWNGPPRGRVFLPEVLGWAAEVTPTPTVPPAPTAEPAITASPTPGCALTPTATIPPAPTAEPGITATPTPGLEPTTPPAITMTPTPGPAPTGPPPPAPLLVRYDFEGDFLTSGIIADRSGNGLDAQVYGAIAKTTGISAGQGISLTGNGYIQTTGNPAAGRRNVTFSLWFETDHPEANYKLASAAWWNGGPGSGWIMATHIPEFWSDDTQGLYLPDLSNNDNHFVPGEWMHEVVTYDGSRIKEYTNGQLINDWPTTGAAIGQGLPMAIGAWPQSSGFNFQGSMDEFQIFGRSLTQQEVQALYIQGR